MSHSAETEFAPAFAGPLDYAAYGPYTFKQKDGEALYQFDNRIRSDGSTPFAPEAGRYHFYLAVGCPYSHRVAILLRLLGLDQAISYSLVDDLRDSRGWAFRELRGPDPINGYAFLKEAYTAGRPGFDGHVSCPTLYDRKTRQVVSNDSGNVIIDLITQFAGTARTWIDLYPTALRPEIDALSAKILDDVGVGVYMTGFSQMQSEYEARARRVFATLDELDARLASQRYLFGDGLTESDVRLYATLVRFDMAYYTLFRTNLRRIADYPNLWAYARDLYSRPPFQELTWFSDIKSAYFRMFPHIYPSGIVPIGPIIDWTEPQDRAKLSKSARN